jgi:hypothetical protein
LFSGLVSGQNDVFITRIIPINDEISLYGEAVFNLTIINTGLQREDFSVYSPNIDAWSVKINPDSVSLNPGQQAWMNIRIKPKPSIDPGREYGVQLNIKSKYSGLLEKAFAFISVKSQSEINREYLPVVAIDIPEIDPIDPTGVFMLAFDIENKNVRDIRDMKVLISSASFTKEAYTDLGPLKKKTMQFPIELSPNTPPTIESMVIRVSIGNDTIISRSIKYEILGVEKSEIDPSVTGSFLMIKHSALFRNIGNLDNVVKYTVKTNLLDYFLISGNTDSRLVQEEGKLYKEYSVELKPGESFRFTATKSYRSILYFILFVILLIVAYYALRSPIVIRKSVSSIKTKEEDILSELKILIHIKNRTKKQFEDVIVLDRIPKITEIGKDFEIGTIKPIKIMNHEKRGTIAKWGINMLDSYEERVIAYKLYTNLNILGGLTLPLAVLKYRLHNGKERTVSSNKINLVIKKFDKKK